MELVHEKLRSYFKEIGMSQVEIAEKRMGRVPSVPTFLLLQTEVEKAQLCLDRMSQTVR